MSRFELAANSIISKSTTVRIGIGVFVAVSITSLALGSTIIPLAMAALAALGISFSTWIHHRWESGKLIPRMRETFATVCVLMSLAIWSVLALFILAIDGLDWCWLGFSLFSIAVSLWIGFGDRLRLIWVVLAISFVVIPMSMLGIDVPSYLWTWFHQLSEVVRNTIGVTVLLGAALMLFAFWRFASAAETSSQLESRLGNNQAAADHDTGSTLDSSIPAVFRWKRVDKIVSQMGSRTWVDYLGGGIAMLFVLVFLLAGRGAAVPICWLSAPLVVFLPTALFMNRVPNSFERLWVTGVAVSRASTFRQLLKVAVIRSAVYNLLILAACLIQSPSSLEAYLMIVAVMMFWAGVGALLVWLASTTFRVWIKMSDSHVLLVLLLGITMFLLISVAIAILDERGYKSPISASSFGLMGVLLLSTLFAIGSWVFAFISVPTLMAKEKVVMEA